MYKNKKSMCVLCGSRGIKITKEHHPTKTLIDNNRIYSNYLVFPTCEQCNNGLSFNEEFLIDFINYYNYYFFDKKIDDRVLHSINRNKTIKQLLNNFFKQNEREKIKKEILCPIFIKYAKIHNYICHEYYNEAEYNVVNISFIDEMKKKDLERFFAPVDIKYIDEEQQIDYFDTNLKNGKNINYLASNYLVCGETIFQCFNRMLPGEYEFILYSDSMNSKIKHFRLNLKNIVFCEITIKS